MMAQSGQLMTRDEEKDRSKDRIKDTNTIMQCKKINGNEQNEGSNICDAIEGRTVRAAQNPDLTLDNYTGSRRCKR